MIVKTYLRLIHKISQDWINLKEQALNNICFFSKWLGTWLVIHLRNNTPWLSLVGIFRGQNSSLESRLSAYRGPCCTWMQNKKQALQYHLQSDLETPALNAPGHSRDRTCTQEINNTCSCMCVKFHNLIVDPEKVVVHRNIFLNSW